MNLLGGGDVGEAIVADARVDCVAFTGSVETGKTIARRCADRAARVNLELGGKDPFIACADVPYGLEVAARGGVWAAFLNAGQVCTSAERFYVTEPLTTTSCQRASSTRSRSSSAIPRIRTPISDRWSRRLNEPRSRPSSPATSTDRAAPGSGRGTDRMAEPAGRAATTLPAGAGESPRGCAS